jgi:bacterioferritin
MPQFVKDVQEIRQRAINRIEDGPVTAAYKVDKERAIAILNEALATEIVCVLRYMHHYFMATGVHGTSVAEEFKEHADAEREHADALAERIQQLGGKPDFNPKNLLERSVTQYIEGESLADMIREDLIAERIVIDVYTEMIRFFGDNDPTTRVLLEGLLKEEENHANELADMLYVVDPTTGRTEGQDPGTQPLQIERERAAARQESRPRAEGEERRVAQRRREQATGTYAGRANAAAPEHQPGGVGRPQRARPQQIEEVEPEDMGGSPQSGATRAVRLTKPNRKKRVA